MEPPLRKARAGTLPSSVPTTPTKKAPTDMPPPLAPITPRARKTPARGKDLQLQCFCHCYLENGGWGGFSSRALCNQLAQDNVRASLNYPVDGTHPEIKNNSSQRFCTAFVSQSVSRSETRSDSHLFCTCKLEQRREWCLFITLFISFSFRFNFRYLFLILELFSKELLLIYLRRIQIMTLVVHVTTLHQYLNRKCKYIHACTYMYSQTSESVGNLSSTFFGQFMRSDKMEGENTGNLLRL